MAGQVFDIFEQHKIELEFFESISREYYYRRNVPGLATADRVYHEIYIRYSSTQRQYNKESYDILTYLGDMGGLFEISLFVGKLLTSLFVGKMFQAALIESAYKI